jgi:lectin, mannose-binding 2
MLGDGETEYDYAHDGDQGSIGGCSVSILCYLPVYLTIHSLQANFRQSSVITKMKLTYLKDTFLNVGALYFSFPV